MIKIMLLTALLSLLLCHACSTEKKNTRVSYTPPPVEELDDAYAVKSKFIWHDLLTHDMAGSKQFYAALFGWRFRTDPENSQIALILNRGQVIGSLVNQYDKIAAGENAVWLVTVSVRNVDKASKTVVRLGGEILQSPSMMAGRDRFAIVTDAQGAKLLLQQGSAVKNKQAEIQAGDWLWMELWTKELQKAAYFYKTMFAFKLDKRVSAVAGQYHFFIKDGEKQAGMLQAPLPDIKPNWLPYVLVANVQATVEKTIQLGGRVVIAPDAEAGQSHVAVIADPAGGVLAVQELQDDRIPNLPETYQ